MRIVLWLFDGEREPPKTPPYPCEDCGALLTMYRDDQAPRWIVQHGENREALLFVERPQTTMGYDEAWRHEVRTQIAAWAARVHAYERGDG